MSAVAKHLALGLDLQLEMPVAVLRRAGDRWRAETSGDRTFTAKAVIAAAAPWLRAGVQKFQIHGWRYSKPLRVEAEPCLRVSQSPPLVLAGDAFAGPRVEVAALSGWAAAAAILKNEDDSFHAR